jgi:hypothetical protein
MTTVPPIIDEAETLVRELATALTCVHEGECLCCYVARQLTYSHCDQTHRHALRYRDAAAPRATALRERLSRVGACCCDCELFLNGYEPNPRLNLPLSETDYIIISATGPGASDPPPPCAGVRRGSVRPCDNWVRIRRG